MKSVYNTTDHREQSLACVVAESDDRSTPL
jgi:hypothetical protein